MVDYLYYKLDLKKIPINLYLDLSTAFDSLLHEILLRKLKYYGICGAAINLMAIENSLFNLKATSQI